MLDLGRLFSVAVPNVTCGSCLDICCARFAFIYDPGSKAQLLGTSNARSQWLAFQRAVFESATQGGAMPYMLLRVSAATSAHDSGCVWSSECATFQLQEGHALATKCPCIPYSM